MSIWTMLLGEGEVREKTSPSAPSSLEQLEPRLLLDANLTDPESLLSLDAVSGLPALVVAVDYEGNQGPTSEATALAASDNSASSEPAGAPEAILSIALPAGDPEITSAMPDNAASQGDSELYAQTELEIPVRATDTQVDGSAGGSPADSNESGPARSSGAEEPVVQQESSQTLPRGPPVAISPSTDSLPSDLGSVEPESLDLTAATDGVAWSSILSDVLLAPKAEIAAEMEGIIAAEPLGSPPLGAAPYGATFVDTSEFMIGDVWVNLVLLESDGSIDPSTEDWTAAEINEVKAEVQEGLTWWQDTFHNVMAVAPVHDLTFHLDFTYADNPIPTGYEPISRPARGIVDEGLWIDDALDHLGYNSPAGYLADVYQWNHDQRIAHNVEWAYTVFVVDSSVDADGEFSNALFAYVYVGGPFLVMTYDNGSWGINNMGEILAHESGHIFYALDESPATGAYTEHSGYYNTQNLNGYDGNPDPGSRVASLMASSPTDRALMDAAYANHTSSPSSLEMIGWKDSDSDGIFDVLDVPLTLDGTGSYNTGTGQWEFTGTSAVQTLANLNPIDLGHDITTNTVDLVQYRVDDGPWVDGNRYGGYNENISQTITAASTATVQLRTICEETGASSPTVYLAGPEVTVLGNGISIAQGDATPSAADGTDFGLVAQGGTPISRTFTVHNGGTAALTLGAVTVPTGFTLAEGLATSLAAGASDTFTVQLNTTTIGTKTAPSPSPRMIPMRTPSTSPSRGRLRLPASRRLR
jgi:hypothetical protein